MHKILIIGPIEDFGGREIETGFIAESLSRKNFVDILSTGNISKKSQVHSFTFNGKILSLKQQIFKKYFILRSIAYLSYFKNKKKQPKYFYVNNNLGQKLGYKNKEKVIFSNLISNYDLVFIVANIGSLRTKEIIELSSDLKKPIIFRTTGEIGFVKFFPEYLKRVSLFLHHSKNNATALHEGENFGKYTLIDQSSQKENEFLKNNILSKPICTFGIISRLSKGKNIERIINYFLKSASLTDKLYIVGDGELNGMLRAKYSSSTNVVFKGYIPSENLPSVFQEFDCLIIPSASEAGPLVGVEAMAAAKIILSTKVGAMEERLEMTYNNYWFDIKSFSSFDFQFQKIKNLNLNKVADVSLSNRNRYLTKYSKENISSLYRTVVSQALLAKRHF